MIFLFDFERFRIESQFPSFFFTHIVVLSHSHLERISYHDSLEGNLSVDLELVGGRDPLAGIDQDVWEEEEHPLLVALAGELVEAALSDEMLQNINKARFITSVTWKTDETIFIMYVWNVHCTNIQRKRFTHSERRPQNIYSQEEINLYCVIKLATGISIFSLQSSETSENTTAHLQCYLLNCFIWMLLCVQGIYDKYFDKRKLCLIVYSQTLLFL